jgi:RNA polymerase sigma-70 factor (ECF subfamily)
MRIDVGDHTPSGPGPTGVFVEGDDFGLFYMEYAQGVYALASRICGARLAADVVQEVFLQFWRKPALFDPSKGTVRSLLFKMAHNKSIDLLRGENAREARERRAPRPDVGHGEIDDSLIRDEMALQVVAALNELTPVLREAIVVAFYGQYTYQEAAVVLNIPEGTAKARIRKGLEQLRTALLEAA